MTGSRRALPALASLPLILLAVAPAGAGELSPGIQKRILAATFEVVQPRPPEGDVAYERALPLDLLPYQARTDHYRPIGTAFALGANRYVTAGHVITSVNGSQAGPPLLRDAGGRVYAIAQVLGYSEREDFVVFSLREPPRVSPLPAGGAPVLNDTVFSVGDALGEGVVIRDGVYTSQTPEDQDGEWRWLRFTAAASPGNSGGPLVDRRGQVIGVVLRRSPQENLNYALPISRVLNAAAAAGRIGGRIPVRFALMQASATLDEDEHFALPLPLADFYRTLRETGARALDGALAQLLRDNATRVFPNGPGSERLLHLVEHHPFPALIRKAQGGSWVVGSGAPGGTQLDHNGSLQRSGGLFRLRAPEDVSIAALTTDSKAFMDLVLKGAPLHRQVGTEPVRVTSLGRATTDSHHTDAYGRAWQVRSWPIPFEDATWTVISLATPDGFVGMELRAPAGLADAVLRQQERLLDFVYVTMEGKLPQWQAYLADRSLAPAVLSSLTIRIDPDTAVRVSGPHFDLEVTPALLRLGRDGILRLNFSYFREGGRVVWDVGGVGVGEGRGSGNWVAFRRRSEPAADMPEGLQDDWRKLVNLEFPYNSTVHTRNNQAFIETAVAQGPQLRYQLSVAGSADQQQAPMSGRLARLSQAFKVTVQ